ncbi:hypothetical protein A0O30_22365 [Pseudomonas sp. LLC-1]|nr:hypothetical protein A0O30_22365 [Pseudomonas sp. LLC-1]
MLGTARKRSRITAAQVSVGRFATAFLVAIADRVSAEFVPKVCAERPVIHVTGQGLSIVFSIEVTELGKRLASSTRRNQVHAEQAIRLD